SRWISSRPPISWPPRGTRANRAVSSWALHSRRETPSRREPPSSSGRRSISSWSMTLWSRAPGSRSAPTGSRSSATAVNGWKFRFRPSAGLPTRSSMPWRVALADERNRYLRQQAELGGPEVILTGGDPAMGTKGRVVEAAGAKWRKGAPRIPGPGLVVESAAVPLVGDPLRGLDTLDAVAERIRTTYCCDLCPPRTHAVPGEGNPDADLVLVGEG